MFFLAVLFPVHLSKNIWLQMGFLGILFCSIGPYACFCASATLFWLYLLTVCLKLWYCGASSFEFVIYGYCSYSDSLVSIFILSSFCRFGKKSVGILIGIALNVWITFVNMDISIQKLQFENHSDWIMKENSHSTYAENEIEKG